MYTGWLDAFIVTMILIVIDFISGVSAAAKNGELSSKEMRIGLWHKFAYMLVIGASATMDYATKHMEIGISMPIFVPVCVAICLTEITSTIENCIKLNPDIKNEKIVSIFNKFEQNNNNNNESEER